MSAATHLIDLEPVATAPTDGRAFDAVIDRRVCLVRVLLGRWQWKVETFDQRAGAPKLAWQYIPEGKQPIHWIKGSIGRHNKGRKDG